MTTITTRSGKGSPLTNNEVDANFTNLNDDKVEASGDSMTGNLSFGDNNKAIFGSATDLAIYSDGTNSYIQEGAGTSGIRITTDNQFLIRKHDNETIAAFNVDGAVRIYHDNSEKLATTSTGIDVTGTVTADGLTVDGNATLQGASSPTLNITDTDTPTTAFISSTNSSARFGSSTNTDVFWMSNNTLRTQIDGATGDIGFYNSAGNSQDLFWDASTSRLGLGTTSPEHALHVNGGTSNTVAQFQSTDANAYIEFLDSDAGASGVFIGGDGDDFVVLPNATEKFRVTSSGNVGIGTSSPSSVLHLSTSNDPQITLTDTGFGASADITGSNGNLRLNSQTATIFDMADSEVMRINSSGQVGINTSSPYRTLTVSGDQAVEGLLEVTAATPQILFSVPSGGLDSRIHNDGSGNFIFGTGTNSATPTERLRIDSSGNVKIGTDVDQTSFLTETTANLQIGGGLIFEAGAGNNAEILNYRTTAMVFGNGGSENMRLDSSGQVGIGTTAPANLMHLEGTGVVVGATQLTLEGRYNGYGAGLEFVSRTSSGGTRATMAKITADGEAAWNTTASTQDAGLRFSTTQDGTLSEKVRILASGNVGIGTSSPSYVVHASTADNTIAQFQSTDNRGAILVSDNDTDSYFGSEGGSTYISNTGGALSSGQLVITSSGNVGIGSAPVAGRGRFQIHDGNTDRDMDANGQGQLHIDGNGYAFGIALNTEGANIYTNSTSRAIIFGTNETERVRIDGSGRLLVGTSSVGYSGVDLTVGDTADSQNGIAIQTSTTGYGYVMFGDGTGFDAFRGQISYKHGDDYMMLQTAGAERMRIDSSGNAVFGKSSANNTAAGTTIYNEQGISVVRDANTTAIFNRLTSDGEIVAFRKDGTTVGSIFSYNGFLGIGSTSGDDAHLLLGSDFVAPATSTGTARDGAIDLGSSSRRFKDLYLSNNIIASGASSPTLNLKDTTYNCNILVYAQNSTAHVGTYSNHPLVFDTNSTERARIDALGNFLIGKTSSSDSSFEFETSQGNSSGAQIARVSLGRSSSGYPVVGYNCAPRSVANSYTKFIADYAAWIQFGVSGRIDTFTTTTTATGSTSGTAGPYISSGGTSWTSSSDRRLKDNIEGISYGLEAVKSLNPVSYVRNDRDTGATELGFIAQEVDEVVSEVVSVKDDGYYGIDYERLIPVLTKAIQDQQDIIENLKSRIEQLEGAN